MARPQSPDYNKKQQDILDAAALVFAKTGFHQASVSDLARQCKISKSLIYHYYPSKDALLLAIMQQYILSLRETVFASINGALPPRTQLFNAIAALLDNYKTAEAKHRVLLQELDTLPRKERNKIVKAQDEIVAKIRKLLEAIASEKNITLTHPTPTTMLFFGMINWTHTWFNPKGPMNRNQLAELCGTLFLDGIFGSNVRE